MALDVVRFVDTITTGRTTRLDLNDGTTWRLTYEGTSLTPPAMARATTSTMLANGERVAGAKHMNRLLRLRLVVSGATADAVATQVQTLHRELDRPFNTLEWKPSAATHPVFFRTLRSSPDSVEEWPGSTGTRKQITVEILAEPYAFGLPVTATGSPFTVNRDPANASNPTYFDVTGVLGDVPAATKIDPGAAFFNVPGTLAIRRRGTPANVPYLHQAEGFTQGTDTTTQANDAAMSGTGNNFSRCSFATATAMTNRLTKFVPTATSVDARGTYRVFVRVRRSNATDVIKVRLRVGPQGSGTLQTTISTVTTVATTSVRYVDMGVIQIPYGIDPIYDGPSGTELAVDSEAVQIGIDAERTSGTGTLDFDLVLLKPADDQMIVVDVGNDSTGGVVFDSYSDTAYAYFTTSVDSSADIVPLGPMLELAPGVTNRVYVRVGHLISGSDAIAVTYWPRYLYVRAATEPS